ncbi:class I SAM-dependent methyltransferase [Sphingobium algorifonticola]|uniref:Class I SAM-dependent methyltransferase n=1 Tax=Sphingobium algorifonticola TaxID=2008318 RepID=A0A437JD04_9SPHN|nr:SAM-dependent methyltransferase [Sphingobium algorifonticola]RVT43754.1 class I SAM-dependent methyltransferase [Sphingobium algorifonticola]
MSDDAATVVPLAERLRKQIEAGGPISVAHYIGEANAHYYATRDPIGAAGDFTTAPEISQMFGELIGLCLADIWIQSGRARAPLYVELGPGRGTLANDALRAMRAADLLPQVHLIETSPVLRTQQKSLLPDAQFHDDLETLPRDAPILAVANEFFDALPTRQIVRTEKGWRERVVIAGDGGGFTPIAGYRDMAAVVPPSLADAPVGSIVEISPAAATVAMLLARRIAQQGGAAIIVDYGYSGPALGDSLQAVRNHAYADPFVGVGEHDLTTHVDFTMIGHVGMQAGLSVLGPVAQGDFLRALGIDARAAQLGHRAPDRAAAIAAARARLVEPEQMGGLFKVMAFVHPDWPRPDGFGLAGASL